MLLKQYFDPESFTYTYLIADTRARKVALIDSVSTKTNFYVRELQRLGFVCEAVLDTHTHADHISGNGDLRDNLGCKTLIGVESKSQCIDGTFKDGDVISVGDIQIKAIHTPGHTDDSYSFLVADDEQKYLFTGDTLLINGSGRTDFQNGDARQQYNSIFNVLLRYPEDTVVYPGHDYNGRTQSTIGEQKRENPRLQMTKEQEYVRFMENLDLPNPKMMDVAVPANQACGKL